MQPRAAVLAASFGLVACTSGTASKHTLSRDAGDADASVDAAASPAALAADGFVWGYPLVVSERTLQTLGAALGANTLFNQTTLSDATSRFIVAPNQDTLYSVAVVDLRGEPMVLTVPDVTDRYWTYQFLDTWTDSFHYIGTRATAGKGGTFVITPPGFTGTIPPNTIQVASPTPEMFLLGRFLVHDAADLANVVAIPRTLVPLSKVLGTAPTLPPRLGVAPGKVQEVGTAGARFFDELGDALSANPPASQADRAALARFGSLGIGPGLHPATEMDSSVDELLAAGATDGFARVLAAAATTGIKSNGWLAHLDIGTYTDPLVRAAVADFGWGANVPAEAVYPVSRTDTAGNPYDGATNYTVHFDADKLPSVDPKNGFWSLTLYGPDMFFVANSINRFAIGDRTPGLTHEADGSLDLYVQNAPPLGHEGNWLPSPTGAFSLMLRFYLPQGPVLNGTYVYPTVNPAAPRDQ